MCERPWLVGWQRGSRFGDCNICFNRQECQRKGESERSITSENLRSRISLRIAEHSDEAVRLSQNKQASVPHTICLHDFLHRCPLSRWERAAVSNDSHRIRQSTQIFIGQSLGALCVFGGSLLGLGGTRSLGAHGCGLPTQKREHSLAQCFVLAWGQIGWAGRPEGAGMHQSRRLASDVVRPHRAPVRFFVQP